MNKPHILATDLDGTLIPRPDSPPDSDQRAALQILKTHVDDDSIEVVFATGRSFESVLRVMTTESLPAPRWIVCDVGSSVYVHDLFEYRLVDAYAKHVSDIAGGIASQDLQANVQQECQLELQEPENQQRFKLSYYCPPEKLDDACSRILALFHRMKVNFGVVSSIDPDDGRGLIDIMPRGVNKAFALKWWAAWNQHEPESIVFAGDSGNDFAALTSGFRGILVGNAAPGLAANIHAHHFEARSLDRLYIAKRQATAGVLDGCRHFEII